MIEYEYLVTNFKTRHRLPFPISKVSFLSCYLQISLLFELCLSPISYLIVHDRAWHSYIDLGSSLMACYRPLLNGKLCAGYMLVQDSKRKLEKALKDNQLCTEESRKETMG